MDGYYSIKEIADRCGVSKPTVQRGIKELNIQPYKFKNKYLYDEVSTTKIIRYITPQIETPGTKQPNETECNKTQETAKKCNKTATENEEIEKDETKRKEMESEKDLIVELLKKQLEEKDKMIDKLLQQNTMLIQTNAFLSDSLEKTRETLLLADQEHKDPDEPQKKSFWKRIFGK